MTQFHEIRGKQIYQKLKKTFPDAHCELIYKNPFELLIATILSAQCTDQQVNKTTPTLFHHYPGPNSMATASLQHLEELIYSTGFYKNKAKNIKACSLKMVEIFSAEVPSSMEQLIQLPGVGRKTANVVLSNAFHKHEGIVVDTHVKRISQKLGLTAQNQPESIEQDLLPYFAQTLWGEISHLFIFLGRRICQARKPHCPQCPLAEDCPSRSLA
jgi:endonuclease-3